MSSKGKIRQYMCTTCGIWHESKSGTAMVGVLRDAGHQLAIIDCWACGTFGPSLSIRYVKPQESE